MEIMALVTMSRYFRITTSERSMVRDDIWFSIQYFHGRRQLKHLFALSKDLSLMNSITTKYTGRKNYFLQARPGYPLYITPTDTECQ